MTTVESATFKKKLVEHGYQITRAREATFHLLISAEPQTMHEVLVKATGMVDRVSVYRNVAVFEKIGLVHRIYIGWKYKLELSDEFTGHHHHLACLKCGKVVDIQDEKHINEYIKEMAHKFGFEPRRHQFEIDGYCKNCTNTIARLPI